MPLKVKKLKRDENSNEEIEDEKATQDQTVRSKRIEIVGA